MLAESTVSKTKSGWFTKQEVARAKGILPENPRFLELCDACVNGLPERDHEDPSLAKLEVKQYAYSHTKTTKLAENKRSLKLDEGIGDVSTSDFNTMRSALAGPSSARMIGAKEAEAARVEDPPLHPQEPKPLEVYKTAFKKTKAAVAAVAAEVNGLEVLTGQLSAISDEQRKTLKAAYQDQVAKANKKLQALKTNKLAEFVAFPADGNVIPEEDLADKTAALQALATEISQQHKEQKKILHPIKKWVANPNQ